jgi:hypothetical protein
VTIRGNNPGRYLRTIYEEEEEEEEEEEKVMTFVLFT